MDPSSLYANSERQCFLQFFMGGGESIKEKKNDFGFIVMVQF